MTSANAMRAFAVAAAVVASSSSASAQSADIVLQEGFSARMSIPGEIHNLAVGNPDIIDAQPLTSNTFLMNAMEQGVTNFIVLDPSGDVIYSARVFVREPDIRPAYRSSVVHGTRMQRRYTCEPLRGCPPKPSEEREVELTPVNNIFLGSTTVNTSASATAVGGEAAPASPPAQ
jgi:hypothetical protein